MIVSQPGRARRGRAAVRGRVGRRRPGSRSSRSARARGRRRRSTPRPPTPRCPTWSPPEDLPAANALAGSRLGHHAGRRLLAGRGASSALFGPYVCFGDHAVACSARGRRCVWRVRRPAAGGARQTATARQLVGRSPRRCATSGAEPRVLALVTVKSAVGRRQRRAGDVPAAGRRRFGVGRDRHRAAVRGPRARRAGRPAADAAGARRSRSWLLPGLAISMVDVRAGLPGGVAGEPGSRWCSCWSSSRTSPAAATG